ncbi:ATP-grasp domain-containing protein [Bergeriella denitrificans]|uniref:Glutathione synthase/Ribosomal protein S6 modification enzyme (Glutaminyl transferase) n=1 Tax=Bergeriella denitrificans TaxID=494 RepID=A0A378UJQ9_BERDE|nr:hypothetical protein [Bergeriella denitrificans]STZ76953.1 Glutathione synthase/Ribosomal protein S6 modification enzyme (glutaminyl transferase) [Bergeriella denitrificans]
MILLVGAGDDPHLTAIQAHIRQAGFSAHILSTEKEALLNTSFTYRSGDASFVLQQHAAEAVAPNIQAVFFLSPLYSKQGFNHSQVQEFWHTTWREALHGYYAHLSQSCFVTNRHIYNALPAQNKISFFRAAQQAGIPAPESLISNTRADILAFFDDGKDVVLKTMHQIYLEYQNQQTMLLVKKVKKEDFADFEGKGECPVFLQKAVDKQFDFRAIIIGDTVLTCKIDASKSLYGNVDWRAYDLPHTVHEIYELPQSLKNKILKAMQYFQLDYACLDFCVDQNGQEWLLDINPFGRFMWIELATGLPISKHIADFLMQKAQSTH